MLVLKPVALDDIKTLPAVECARCYASDHPNVYFFTAVDWLQFAHNRGWRAAETDSVIYSTACPQCIAELTTENKTVLVNV